MALAANSQEVTEGRRCRLEDILATGELALRPHRSPNFEAENQALVKLASELATSPETILMTLAETAVRLTGAHSGGISIEEMDGSNSIFRWHATAGEFVKYLGGTMPRSFSPCGTVLDMQQTLLMIEPIRYYPYISKLQEPLQEVLLVPFARGDKLIGTVWVVSHDTAIKQFDAEDERLITSLSRFAAAATKTVADTKALNEADLRKTEFLATLAHELRNPLAPIRNGLEILKRAGDEDSKRQARAMIERQTGQMAHLIDDLMDVARISSGKIELRKSPLDVRVAINNAVEATASAANLAGHAISIVLPGEMALVNADNTWLTQILSNLLGNAIKYTPASGHIAITAEYAGGFVLIRITDNGIGIAPEQVKSVFEMFGQIDHSVNRREGGLGIGLAISRTLAEMHDGSITAESGGVGQGSSFVLKLPVCGGEPDANRKPAGKLVEAPSRSLKILIVEDNKDAADSLATLLTLSGHDLRVAHSGEHALTVFKAFQPDVAFLDIGLPEMSGYEVARQFRGQSSQHALKLVAMTGWGSSDDKARARDAGFDAHITKPADYFDLISLLSRLTGPQPGALS